MMPLVRKGAILPTSGLALALLLAGCEESNTYVEPPPPKVTVAEPLVQEVTDYLEFTGTTVATAKVEVRARVSGVLQSMHFAPGTDVAQGDLLFVIDPVEYEADLQAAEAELAAAKARKIESEKTLERSRTLIKRGHISQAKLDEAEANARVAKADVLIREAKLRQAEINLGYTQVTAAISGRVGRNMVDVGNLVGKEDATLLTDLTAYDPIYVYFNLNERDLLRVLETYRKRLKEKGLDPKRDPGARTEVKLSLGLANEEGYPHEGVFDFAESDLDAGTGTLQLRGIFDNAEAPPVLYPGLFARVRMEIAKRPDMPLVSERAIGTDQGGRYVLTVNSENVVEKHFVRTGPLVDGLRIIEEGLRADDRVVVNGMQRARPGGKVEPEETDMASLTASARRAAIEAAKKQEADGEPDAAGSETDTQTAVADDQAETASDTAGDGALDAAADGAAADQN